MTHSDDALVFADEPAPVAAASLEEPWNVLIVDDEDEVHRVTRLVLGKTVFMNRGLRFHSAYSAAEAREILHAVPDIAVVLLDVVMEDDNAGLDLARYIRQDMGNAIVRLILRTGQPGRAPESSVILEYDINDYKEKTELTAQKLFTVMIAAIRSYRDLVTIERSRSGLEKIIQASAHTFELQSLKRFTAGVLEQITTLVYGDRSGPRPKLSGFAAVRSDDGVYILSAIGEYETFVGRKLEECMTPEIQRQIDRTVAKRSSTYEDDRYVGYIETKSGSRNILCLDHCVGLSKLDTELISIYCMNVAVAFENIHLNSELEDTQKELIFTLGEVIEQRSEETGNHVRRVAEYVKHLGLLYGLPENEAEIASVASAIHDVGKIAIPDGVLNKPFPLDEDEYRLMMKHTILGQEMLQSSRRKLFSAASLIAAQHHERWDGTGYPHGLKGERIHLYARISAIADVFDALISDRVYRKAWSLEDARAYILDHKGTQFDPELVHLFELRFDEFAYIAKGS